MGMSVDKMRHCISKFIIKIGYYFSSLLKAQNANRRCAKLVYSTFMDPEILAEIVV